MKAPRFALVVCGLAAGVFALPGCISVSETQVSDDPRVAVSFENDRAARLFYETLAGEVGGSLRTEKRESVSLILINVDKRTVSGPNRAFNHAVAFCDSDGDRVVTEHEAGIFATEWPRQHPRS